MLLNKLIGLNFKPFYMSQLRELIKFLLTYSVKTLYLGISAINYITSPNASRIARSVPLSEGSTCSRFQFNFSTGTPGGISVLSLSIRNDAGPASVIPTTIYRCHLVESDYQRTPFAASHRVPQYLTITFFSISRTARPGGCLL